MARDDIPVDHAPKYAFSKVEILGFNTDPEQDVSASFDIVFTDEQNPVGKKTSAWVDFCAGSVTLSFDELPDKWNKLTGKMLEEQARAAVTAVVDNICSNVLQQRESKEKRYAVALAKSAAYLDACGHDDMALFLYTVLDGSDPSVQKAKDEQKEEEE